MNKLLLSVLFLFGFIAANCQVTVTFVSPTPSAPTMCLDTWSEQGVPMQIVPKPPGGSCFFDYDGGGDLWLFPARMATDLTVFAQIDSIQISFEDFCGIGCTKLYFLSGGVAIDSAANGINGVDTSYTFITGGGPTIDQMTFESFEGVFYDYTVYGSFGSPPCDVINQIEAEDGDIYVEESCHGVILKSDGGFCYRIRVDDDGILFTEAVDCP